MTMLEVLQHAFRNSGVEFLTQEVYAASDIPLLVEDQLRYEHQNSELNDKTVIDISFEDPRLPFLKQYRPIFKELRAHGYHLEEIAETSKALPSGRDKTTYFFRMFKESDYPCKEHPELLLGQPIGQYHCPRCGAMQCAGTPHSKEQ